MLIIDNLVKRYKKVKAVDGLSLRIEKGHIYGFVGANGAGKTTTMKIVAGLLKPTSGKVVVDGMDLAANPGKVKEKIGYMPDFFGVYDDLKVSEYMSFYASVYGIPRKERAEATGQLIELVNLTHKIDSYVDSLSRGMKQRLCLARSLIHDPELLILDEPASGLDPRARAEVKEILKELKDMGKTILISSHILPELAELCTSMGVIENGRMVLSGTVDEIMQKAQAKRQIRIKVLGKMDAAARLLEEKPYMGGVAITNDYIRANFNGSEEKLKDILKEMVMQDIPVVSFSEAERNLESVFMNLTLRGDGNEV